MTSVFYIHLIATLVNMFFIGLLWWYNHKLIKINYQLMKDNSDIIIKVLKLQDQIIMLEAKEVHVKT